MSIVLAMKKITGRLRVPAPTQNSVSRAEFRANSRRSRVHANSSQRNILQTGTAFLCCILALGTRSFAGQLKLPDIDVVPHCRDAAALGAQTGIGSKSVFLTCMKQEQEHYDNLKASKWQDSSEEVRKVCAPIGATYESIDFCLDRESQANEELKTFKFKK